MRSLLLPSLVGLSLFLAAALYLSAAEPRTVPGLNLTLVPIPAGSFTMGSPMTEAGRWESEGPQTRVTLSQLFWLGRTEVTYAQWRAVMGTDLVEQARRALADETLYNLPGKQQRLRDFLKMTRETDPKALVYNAGDDAPMYWVNWEEAAAFCRRLNQRKTAAGLLPSGYEYRLPTEAEWEYACRAGSRDETYAGKVVIKGTNDAPVLDSIAWYRGNSSEGYTGKGENTADWPEKQFPGGIAAQRDVGLKRPNLWGLYDMLGNVWEWCGDRYGKLPGGKVSDPTGPVTGSLRVIRGGSWSSDARHQRAAVRDLCEPGFRFSNIGFRLALAPGNTH